MLRTKMVLLKQTSDLKQDNVAEAIAATGVDVEWDAKKSSLPGGKNEEANDTPSGGEAGGNGGSTGDKTDNANGGNGGSNGNNGGSTGGSTGGKTGSGSTTKTGFETTAIFVMLGVMIAAAGVVVIARRKENA